MSENIMDRINEAEKEAEKIRRDAMDRARKLISQTQADLDKKEEKDDAIAHQKAIDVIFAAEQQAKRQIEEESIIQQNKRNAMIEQANSRLDKAVNYIIEGVMRDGHIKG